MLGTVLRRCLHKDRKQRIRDIGDVSLALTGAFDTTPETAQALEARRSLWRRAMPVAAALVLGGLLVTLIARSRPPSDEPRAVTRFPHHVPPDQTFRSNGRVVLALSPDGRHFVYNTERGLYLRSMGALEAQVIPGTETRPGREDSLQEVAGPFFAPGGERDWIFRGRPVEADRHPRRCAVRDLRGRALVRRQLGTRQYDSLRSGRRHHARVRKRRHTAIGGSGEGGRIRLWTAIAPRRRCGSLHARRPRLAATAGTRRRLSCNRSRRAERTVLLQGSDARYVATGHLLYAQDDALFAVPFDPGRRALLGGPVSVVNGVVRAGDRSRQTPAANYGISDNGTLVYLTGRGFSHRIRSAHSCGWTGEGVRNRSGRRGGVLRPAPLARWYPGGL